ITKLSRYLGLTHTNYNCDEEMINDDSSWGNDIVYLHADPCPTRTSKMLLWQYGREVDVIIQQLDRPWLSGDGDSVTELDSRIPPVCVLCRDCS
ncbi:hypothetical protein FOZ62_014823, partial [Perkinsus olseni]